MNIEFKEVAQYDLSNSTWVARIADSLMLRKLTYTFYLDVSSGASSIITGPFSLNVYCGLNSATISESTYSLTQIV